MDNFLTTDGKCIFAIDNVLIGEKSIEHWIWLLILHIGMCILIQLHGIQNGRAELTLWMLQLVCLAL